MKARATQPAPHDLGSLTFLFAANGADRRRTRIALAIAVLAHAGLFAITWPTIARSQPGDEGPPARALRLHRVIPRPSPPPPPPVDAPRVHEGPPVPIPGPPIVLEPTVIRDPTIEVPESWAGSEEAGGDPLSFPDPPPPPSEDTVAVVGVDVEPPTLLHRVEPAYPELARAIRKEGAVILSLTIDRSGRVRDVAVLRGQPFGLTEAAVTAARQWVFEPSTVDGRPVRVQYILTVHFHLGGRAALVPPVPSGSAAAAAVQCGTISKGRSCRDHRLCRL